MTRTITAILSLSLLTSCIQSLIVPRKIKKQFTLCYDKRSTGLEAKINTNGYYEFTDIWWNESGYGKTYNPRWDTTQIAVLFFDDGIFAYQYLGSEANIGGGEISATYKGVYRVIGDTIQAQRINDCRRAMPTWMGYEMLFKIVDRNTIVQLGGKALHQKDIYREVKATGLNTQLGHFKAVDSLPSSDIWLKKRKWFWCER